MANKIKVDTKRLGTDADKVRQAIAGMKTDLQKMQAQALILDAMWDGPASDAFKQSFRDDAKALSQIITKLENMHQFEVKAKKQYEKCENSVAQTVKGIRV